MQEVNEICNTQPSKQLEQQNNRLKEATTKEYDRVRRDYIHQKA